MKIHLPDKGLVLHFPDDMTEEAQFAEDGTPENPLSEADLVRYQEIQDAMKRRDYAALSAMRGEAEGVGASVTAGEATKGDIQHDKGLRQIREVLDLVKTKEGRKNASRIVAEFAPVTEEQAQAISAATGEKIDADFTHTIDGGYVFHVLRGHGEGREKIEHQLPIVEEDFERIPDVVAHPDKIGSGNKTRQGLNTVAYSKRINGHILVVEAVRNGAKKLSVTTLRKLRPGYEVDFSTPDLLGAKETAKPLELTSDNDSQREAERSNAFGLKADEGFSTTSETSPTPSGPVSAASPSGLTLPPSGEGVNARTLEDGENFEGYEQQGVGPAGTAPGQVEAPRAKGSVHPRTPAEIRRLAKDMEARMIAAGRDVEEAKAMGLLASEFASRFAKRAGIQPAEALNFEMRQGKAQGARGSGYDQFSVRQSEDYDPGDPKTWPAGQARDEALALEAWQNLENDDEVETWPESPEKARALELQNESRQIDAWIENLSREEFDRRLRDDDPEFVWKNERGVELEKELRSLRRDLRKKKPKGAERRLLQLIEAEEAAAAREAEDAQEYYQERPETTENIRRGQAAMEKVIAEQTDVMDAMHRDDLGSISFLWGEPGRGDKFKGGWGVSHLIAHRNAQGYDGEAVARKMVEVIAQGEITKRYAEGSADQERVNITHKGYEAHLGLFRYGQRMTWLITGYEVTKKAPDVSGEGSGSSGTTLLADIPRTDEEGAGAFNEKSPGAPSEGDGSTGATLSGPMRTRPKEGAGDSDNSKPPVAQKDKGESTAPNGRTYFLPDGTSVIEFFETANKSTSFHEFGHHILNKMVEFSGLEGVDPQLAEDVKTILEEAGVSREAFDADTNGARTKAHEFFARGFETYLSEGKAPTARLRDAFRRIRNWMIEVYNDTAKALGIKLSDEMRGVYNRLFASDGAFGDIYGAEDVKAGTNAPAQTQEMVTTTTRKGVEIVMRRASRPAWRTAETDAVAEELERKMLAVGKDREEARVFARVGASVAGMLARRANISPADAMKLTFRRGEDAVQGEGFAQPLNPDVDLGAKVNVVKAQRTMPDVPSYERGKAFTPEMRAEIVERFRNGQVVNAHTGLTVTLSKSGGLDHVIHTARGLRGEAGKALYQAIPYLDQLAREAYRVESHDDRKPSLTKVEGQVGNLKQVHRFLVPVDLASDQNRIQGDRHVLLLTAKEYEAGKAELDSVSLYDMKHAKKMSGRSSRDSLDLTGQASRNISNPDNISVRELVDAVNDAEGRPYLYDPVGEEYRQIGTKRKNEMDASLAKHRPDLTPEQRTDAISEIEKLGEEVKAGGSPKHEKAATKWLLGGHIILPEDNYKILDALKICEQQHLDPMSFGDPNEILAKYTIKESAAEKRVNPDTVLEFSDKKEYPDGITVYTVQNDKAGQAAVRKIIDTHWGKDANPWCLAARGKRGGMGDAWRMWQHYDAIPKRIAFRNGKLLAFCASDKKGTQWWDREDESFSVIPYISKRSDGVIIYGYHEDLGYSSKVKEKLKDGTLRKWYPSGQMEEEFSLGGTYTTWYENGRKRYEALPDKTVREWYKDGQIKYESLPDGTAHKWAYDGLILSERLSDGTHIEWTWAIVVPMSRTKKRGKRV